MQNTNYNPNFDPSDHVVRPLRDHQLQLLAELRSELRPAARIILSAPTGSGKTLTANEFIYREFLERGHGALWIAPNWNLLAQALGCLVRRYGDVIGDEELCYIARTRNSDNSSVTSYCTRLSDSIDPRVTYTTLQSLYSLLQSKGERRKEWRALREFSPGCIVIDESHYAANGEMERAFRGLLSLEGWRDVVVIAASATPSVRAGFDTAVGYSDVQGLIGNGVLAKPSHIPVTLKAPSRVRLDSNNLITPNTYQAIAGCEKRNEEIASHIYSNAAKYGKTIIFCCNKEHANKLARRLLGLNPLVIHGDVPNAHQCLAKFASESCHKIALLVRMGTMGWDVPDIKTVVLAKPTTSQAELVQMIGRGQRVTSTKKSFNVVDFFENLGDETVSDKLAHFSTVKIDSSEREKALNVSSSISGAPLRRSIPLTQHTFVNEPVTEILKYDPSHPAYAALNGLQINPRTTFGLEFEVTSDAVDWQDENIWERVGNELIKALTMAVGRERVNQRPVRTGIKSLKFDRWNVVWDGTCGWEAVTPILCGSEGFEEVVAALDAIKANKNLQKKYKIKVNSNTGCHVHFGYNYRMAEKFRNLVQFVRRFEGALFTLCAASRYTDTSLVEYGDEYSTNEYCMPLLGAISDDDVQSFKNSARIRETFCNHEMRYHTVNLSLFDTSPQRLEVRMHSGTLDAKKILLWVSLWQNIFSSLDNLPLNVTGFRSDADHPQISSKEDGDIVFVAARYLGLAYDHHKNMLTKLHERRREAMSTSAWRKVLGARKQKAILEGWERRLGGN